MPAIRPTRVNHFNLILQDYEASVAHMERTYDAEFLADIPQKELRACLFEIGRVIFEAFVPLAWLPNARYGAHYVGLEYQADMDVVRAAIAERGIRIVRDIGVALHTHPEDTFGVAFEFYAGWFHDRDWAALGGAKMRNAEDWAASPIGLTGLIGYTMVVADIAAAITFLQGFLGAEPAYEEARPEVAARAIGLTCAGSTIELLTPTGEGPIDRHLRRFGDGIHAARLGVRDIDAARAFFAERGVAVESGSAPDSLAVPAEANMGVIFEFVAGEGISE